MRLAGIREVLVEVEAVERKTEGGIYLTAGAVDDAQSAVAISRILDMTDDLKNDPKELLKIGDRVLTPRYFGSEVPIKSEKKLVIHKRPNILAVLDDHEEGRLDVR